MTPIYCQGSTTLPYDTQNQFIQTYNSQYLFIYPLYSLSRKLVRIMEKCK
jgi:hypothetical protein